MSKASEAQADRDEYAADLRALLPIGSTIATTSEYASSRATTAHVRLFVAKLSNTGGAPYIHRLTYVAAKVMGASLSDRGGIKYGGYGYSKEYQAVYGLGRALYPNGFECIGDGCPSNDHTNGQPRAKGLQHSDGGYAYRQASL